MSSGRNTTGAATGKARVRKATGRKARGRKALLDLTTIIERPFITIDGEDYELVTRNTASLLTSYRAQEASKALGNADIKAAVVAKDWVEAEAIMGRIGAAQEELVRLALPTLPDDVLECLSMEHKSAIISAFGQMVSSQTPTATPSPESPQTGENGSPDSTDSTEPETPGSG